MSESFLKNQLLIAMPTLMDPNFFHAVAYICEHTEEGAMGIVINHPLDISVSDLLNHMDIEQLDESLHYLPVLAGGPVQQERGFVLHRPEGAWQSSLEASEEVSITTSKDILVAIGKGEGPSERLIALGYAGWDAGQLEQELKDNAWLNCEADPTIFFEIPPKDRWKAAANLLGIDLRNLSNDVGHA